MNHLTIYLVSVPLAFAVFVVLHKRGIFWLPSPVTALAFAVIWPVVVIAMCAKLLWTRGEPRWDALMQWWER